MKMNLILAVALFGASTVSAYAYKGSADFTYDEVARHQAGLPTVLNTASNCLKADIDYHLKFYKQWGISPLYGDRSAFARVKLGEGQYRSTTKEEKLRQLYGYGLSQSQAQQYLRIMRPTSCIGLVLKCLGKGFEEADQADIWKKLRAFVMANSVSGGALQEGLQNLGWKLMYWNPDTSMNGVYDREDQRRNPENPDYIWGKHAYNWMMVKKQRKYLYNRVDDVSSLVNFGEQVPHAIRKVPFFVGVANMGYHVFPGSYGRIIEGHSTRRLSDRQTIESSPFNPLMEGGGPRGYYRSGLVAVPPGYASAMSYPDRGDGDSYNYDDYYEAPRAPVRKQKRRRYDDEYRGPTLFNFW